MTRILSPPAKLRLLAVVSLLWLATAAHAVGTPAVPVDEFLGSLGINSAISRRGETLADTIRAARYLGLRWFRSGYESGVPIADLIELHRQTGVRFSYGLMSGGADLERLLEGARKLAAAGALLALEGNNEPNNWALDYGGQRGGGAGTWLPVARLQRDLYRAVRAGTLMPEGTPYADAANCHNYITHPGWPGLHDNQTWVAADPGRACRVDGLYGNYGVTWRRHFPGYAEASLATLPRVTTETGVTIEGPFTEAVQSWLYLSVYLDQFKRGWKHTAIYLLRDRSDESGNQTFGLYRSDYTPRQAAVYLHNLTRILASDAAPGKTQELDYSISNQPETVHDLLLQKNAGRLALVLWDERFTGGSDRITVHLGAPVAAIAVLDPTIGTAPVRQLRNLSSVDLTLSNHPVVLEVSTSKPD